MKRLDRKLINNFKNLDTPCISDSLDSMGVEGALLGIQGITYGSRICGQAFTVHYVPCGVEKGTVGDFLDDVEAGDVVVIDNAGRDYCTVWGDIMSIVSNKNKLGGTIIDGVCRDVKVIKEIGYPLFSKGRYMRTGKDRVEVDAVNIPVSISGINVKPGDLIVADENGALRIPLEIAEAVFEKAISIEEKENAIINDVKSGKSLKEARQQSGYHHLQTKNI